MDNIIKIMDIEETITWIRITGLIISKNSSYFLEVIKLCSIICTDNINSKNMKLQ